MYRIWIEVANLKIPFNVNRSVVRNRCCSVVLFQFTHLSVFAYNFKFLSLNTISYSICGHDYGAHRSKIWRIVGRYY